MSHITITEQEDPQERRQEKETIELLREILNAQRHTNHILREFVYHRQPPHHYGLKLTLVSPGDSFMATAPITTIPLGGQVQLVVQLTSGGVVVVPQPASFAPAVTSSDSNVAVTPATADVTGGVASLAQQFLLTDAASDTFGAPDAITATATAPDGTALTETLSLTIGQPATSPFGLSMGLFAVPGAAAAAVKR